MTIKKLLPHLYLVYTFLFYIPFFVLSTFLCGMIAMVLVFTVGPKGGAVMAVIWGRVNAIVAPMIVRIHGLDKIDPSTSYVITANHQSQTDIFVLYGWLPMDSRWVMKQELRHVPFIGHVSYYIGHIFIDRSNHEAAVKSIDEAKERIKEGVSVLFFPEGTRGISCPVRPFKKGAFRFALDMDMPVLPITVNGTATILPPKSVSLFPGVVDLVIHDPIDQKQYSTETLDQFADDARAAVQSGVRDDNCRRYYAYRKGPQEKTENEVL